MTMNCPRCDKDPLLLNSCKVCQGAGTLCVRDAPTVFAIYCRTAMRIQLVYPHQPIDYASAATDLGLTKAQYIYIYSRAKAEQDTMRRLITANGVSQKHRGRNHYQTDIVTIDNERLPYKDTPTIIYHEPTGQWLIDTSPSNIDFTIKPNVQ